MAELSPMMKQYFQIKEENKDSILFFRLGDFYEMFYDDAKLASKELELTLTGRDCGQEERAPMCGVPFHSAESYIARLVSKGYKVAICEQTEDPKAAKGLVKRDIIRVITPGTVMESSMLDESENNYICSMYADKSYVGIVFCDISTGQLFVSRFKSDHSFSQLKDQITAYSPKELLICGKLAQNKVLHLFLFGDDGILLGRLLVGGEEHHVGLILLVHRFGFGGQCLDFALPALGNLVELLVGHFVLRNLLQDVVHIDQRIFLCKAACTDQHHGDAC